jgi:hypothetical protein
MLVGTTWQSHVSAKIILEIASPADFVGMDSQ